MIGKIVRVGTSVGIVVGERDGIGLGPKKEGVKTREEVEMTFYEVQTFGRGGGIAEYPETEVSVIE